MPASRRSGAAANTSAAFREIYTRLERTYGGDTWHWSPEHVRGPIDIIVSAILVQHTVWANAERALEALRDAGFLKTSALASMPDYEMVPLLRVSGTPTVKARRLRAIATTVEDAGGMDAFLALPDDELRRLLATDGVGPETADAIMLYAARRRVLVIDAYTQRLLRRLGLGPEGADYGTWQRYCEGALPDADASMFQRFHAYNVLHGKALCRPKPRCGPCPLLDLCPTGQTATAAAPTRAPRHR